MRLTRPSKLALGIAGIIYLGLLYKLLLTPTIATFNHVRRVNLIPFKTITENLTDTGTPFQHRAYELLGNLAVLTPIGIYLAFVRRKFSIWPVLGIGIGMSSSVEITQYLNWTWRVADVDDVICNASGALIAYVFVAYTLHRLGPKQFPTLRRLRDAKVADLIAVDKHRTRI
ncbi:MAG TPA: VanZ family protein [Candidatus Nanopelagicaceae bacterium]|nr:VanZ family protein [Candidatus Nanopelagicaceae bacterium]